MASVFTYDPNPPKVSSPWPGQSVSAFNLPSTKQASALSGAEICAVACLADFGITKLVPEPQEGPTEYKLHLLLRPRRSFVNSSTIQHVSGSYQSKSRPSQPDTGSELRQTSSSSSPVPSSQSRQNRLQHLTTQLLWRLQQSSPYHSSSKSDLVIPVLPQAAVNLPISGSPEKPLPGLEESQGALYELGVSDDGACVGLAEDELEESLTALRAMAFSLGCRVQVLRKVIVGDCEWEEEAESPKSVVRHLRHEKLFVVEALVFPNLDFCQDATANHDCPRPRTAPSLKGILFEQSESQTEQLRISLTGSTTSGKSSLLGTLSTSTLDNGRGKSRLSLLKHRHEIVSGISSSVTPELIGYQDTALSGKNESHSSSVINYASGNISSWNDIHSASEPGRLVLLTDSAGHPRYRRTAVRGLVSWAPHWTMCCIAADSDDGVMRNASETAQDRHGSEHFGFDSSTAYLSLCLRLNLPLIVIVTKYDLASKTGLRQMLNSVLSILKQAGRTPCFVQKGFPQNQCVRLQSVATEEKDAVMSAIAACQNDSIHLTVPIVLTSTVSGTGINTIHALLRHLPIPRVEMIGIDDETQGAGLFHIDEVFSKPNIQVQQSQSNLKARVTILSGHLRYGDLAVGDVFLIGPFTGDGLGNNGRDKLHRANSFPGIFKQISTRYAIPPDDDDQPLSEDYLRPKLPPRKSYLTPLWRKARIVSLRNLRLPVRKILAGQVGTVGVTWDNPGLASSRVRKGMVMIHAADSLDIQVPSSFSGFAAIFDAKDCTSLVVGNCVVVYFASVRTTARIVNIQNDIAASEGSTTQQQQQESTELAFEFVASREWIEQQTQVLVMAENRHRFDCWKRRGVGSGLNGFVGRITRAFK